MASGWTNKGKMLGLEAWLRRTANGGALPTNLYVGLVTSATAPTSDTNTFGQMTEIAAGNGYTTGGFSLTPGAADFDVLTEDDTGDLGLVQCKDVSWTASGGPIPASGNGARYAVLIDDNVTVGSREVYAWWDLTSDRSILDTETLRITDLQLTVT